MICLFHRMILTNVHHHHLETLILFFIQICLMKKQLKSLMKGNLFIYLSFFVFVNYIFLKCNLGISISLDNMLKKKKITDNTNGLKKKFR